MVTRGRFFCHLYKNNDSIIKPQTASDYDEAEKEGRSEIEKAVKSSSAITEAEQNLKDSISGFLQGLYGEDVEIVLIDCVKGFHCQHDPYS